MASTMTIEDIKALLELALAAADELQLHDVGIGIDRALVAATKVAEIGITPCKPES